MHKPEDQIANSDLNGRRTMRQILGAALLLAEIIASVWAVDLAFSLISDPSTWLLIAGIWLLFSGGSILVLPFAGREAPQGRAAKKGRRRCR